MNNISDISTYGDTAILQNIGEFIKATRINQHLTQDEVAEKAAISRSTLSLIERGENTSLINLLKILRVLNALHVFDSFRIQTTISPLKLAKEEEKRRKRASKKDQPNPNNYTGW